MNGSGVSVRKRKKAECFGCGFETNCVLVEGGSFRLDHKEDEWLCDICSGTYVGNAAFYPDQYEDYNSMRLIAYIGNMILSKTDKR